MFKNLLFKNLSLRKGLSKVYSDVDGLSLQNLFYTYNGYFPNCYMFTHSQKTNDYLFNVSGLLEKLKSMYSKKNLQYIQYITRNLTTKEEKFGFCAVLKKENLFIRIEPNINESYILYDNLNCNELMEFVNLLTEYYVPPTEDSNNIYKIAVSPSGGYFLAKAKIKEVKDFNIDLQYNADFPYNDNKIKKFIENKDKSGILILHGEKGTGKTTYIRHLISSYPDKKFVFVSPDLLNVLGTPAFTNFLGTLYEHIIILEDCENAIRDRKNTGSTSAVSTLLNMSDGLLADDLSIKFICTFNADVKDIDTALMRKGRLICKYEFKPLTVEKTNALLKHIYGQNENSDENFEYPQVTKGLTLADIYNFEDDSYEVTRKKILGD